ncbi:MAG: hypothetical protein DRQ47_01900 [Gammaproteobacteria bacterium]|nr:MAG: hypothetical protein DRQ47_01900 [Gammaproteobacteria bacterium]
MRAKEFLNEADVVQGNFGQGEAVPGIPVPPGFDSFYAKKYFDRGAYQVIGVKGNKEKVISTVTSEEGAKALASHYNSGKSTSIQPLSMAKAFGSEEYNIIADAGYEFIEKPSYFSNLRRKAISILDLQKIKNALKAEGYKLKIYGDEAIFGYSIDEEEDNPQMSVVWKPEESVFLISMSATANLYLVDQQGASKYIRFWLGINT